MRALLLLWAGLSLAHAEPYSFKSWKLGAAQADIAPTAQRCRPGPLPSADYTCFIDSETIAERPIQLVMLGFYDEHLDTISIGLAHEHFRHVATALIARYGPPTNRESRPMVTRAGVNYDSERLEWVGPESRIVADERAGRIDRSFITFRMNSSVQKFQERRDRQAKGASKDL